MQDDILTQFQKANNVSDAQSATNDPILNNFQKANSGIPSGDTFQSRNILPPINADQSPEDSNNIPINPNTGNTDYTGWCQAFVEQEKRIPQKFGSASIAWDNYAQEGKAITDPSLTGIKKGDLIYFQNPNDPDGHVGIYEGNGSFTSATDTGIRKDYPLSNWLNETGQSILGFVPEGGIHGKQ